VAILEFILVDILRPWVREHFSLTFWCIRRNKSSVHQGLLLNNFAFPDINKQHRIVNLSTSRYKTSRGNYFVKGSGHIMKLSRVRSVPSRSKGTL